MEPRYGRLYSTAVLRPLAEQLVAALGVQPGEVVCDLLSDSATLGAAFAAVVGVRGRVVLVDSVDALPEPASCDRVGSLCTFGFWTGASLLDDAMRSTREGGVAAIVTWDPDHPPAHERVLVEALRDVAGIGSRFLGECLAAPAPDARAGWHKTVLRDVARFDGIAQYWTALVQERPALTELGTASAETVSAVRDACEVALQQHIAADGTMRIPVNAVLWRRDASRRD